MSIRIIVFVAVIYSYGLLSCSDITEQVQENDSGKELVSVLTGSNTHDHHFVVIYTEFLGRLNGSFSFQGSITNPSTFEYLDGGTATIAGIQIESSPEASNPGSYELDIWTNDNVPLPTFGQQSTFALAGNSDNNIAAWSESFYLPDVVHITSTGLDEVEDPFDISKTENYTLTWNADPNNSLPVIVYLQYMQGLNQDRDGLPSTSVMKPILTEDDGAYTFSTDDFSGMPEDARFWVSVIRGDYRIVEASDNLKYLVYGASMSKGIAELKP